MKSLTEYIIEQSNIDLVKTYHIRYNVGKSKYVVDYYTGDRLNKDGSLASDIAIFSNKTKGNAFINKLIKDGYKGNGLIR